MLHIWRHKKILDVYLITITSNHDVKNNNLSNTLHTEKSLSIVPICVTFPTHTLRFSGPNKSPIYTRWFKYDRDYLCVNKSQFVPVIFEPPCTMHLGSIKTNDARCARKIKSRTDMTKATLSRKNTLFTSKLDLNWMKKLVKFYICSIASYGTETWKLQKIDQKCWKVMWCYIRMKISWSREKWESIT